MMKLPIVGLSLSILAWCGCGEPEPIVTGAPQETEQWFEKEAPNVVDPSQPVSGTNRGDVIEGRHIPAAAPRLTNEGQD